MILVNLVKQNINKTNQEIQDLLNTDVTISSDNTLYTIAQLRLTLNNVDALRLVCGTIKAAGEQDPLIWAFSQKLFSTGISFADAETQAMIDGLAYAGSWPDSIKNAIKRLGVVTGKKYAQLGLANLPTLDEIQTARARVAEIADIQTIIDELSQIMSATASYTANSINDILTPAISNGSLYADVKPLVNTLQLDQLIDSLNAFKASVS